MRGGGRRTTLGTSRRLVFDEREVSGPDYSCLEGSVRHCVIEGRAWKSEDIETNCCNAVLGAWLDVRISPRRLLRKFGSQAAPSHRPVAFTLEGLPLDAYHGE
jgi:hypothetical protein